MTLKFITRRFFLGLLYVVVLLKTCESQENNIQSGVAPVADPPEFLEQEEVEEVNSRSETLLDQITSEEFSAEDENKNVTRGDEVSKHLNSLEAVDITLRAGNNSLFQPQLPYDVSSLLALPDSTGFLNALEITSPQNKIVDSEELINPISRIADDEETFKSPNKFESEESDGVDFQNYLRMFYKEPWLNADEEGEGDLIDIHNRNGLLGDEVRWKNGEIPFALKNLRETAVRIIKEVLGIYHTRTCIRFRPWTPHDQDFIVIDGNTDGCLSYMGRSGGRQDVQLSNKKCFRTLGTSFHELMHVLGFDHEQNRHDRDDYVDIVRSNIKPDRFVNFEKLTGTSFEVPYDFGSVMHYSFFAFAKNTKKPTMVPLNKLPRGLKVGQRDGPSEKDIMKINRMYNCTGYL